MPDDDEIQIEQALSRRGTIDFVQTGLQDALQTLSLDFQVPIVLARKKLDDAGIRPDVPITRKLQRLPLESILRLLLSDLELAFAVRDHVILITTEEDAEAQPITRVYPIFDLVVQRGIYSASSITSENADYDSLIEVITTTIKPDSWDDVGGPGAIEALDNAGALAVSQSRDVHRELETLLIALRKAKASQGIASLPVPRVVSFAAPPTPANDGRAAAMALPAWQVPRIYRSDK